MRGMSLGDLGDLHSAPLSGYDNGPKNEFSCSMTIINLVNIACMLNVTGE